MSGKEVAVLEKKTHPLVDKAEALKITDAKSMTVATELLSQLNKMGDGIQSEKDKVMKPLNQAIKAERARWKPIETILERGIATLRAGMTKYQTAATAIANEKAAKVANRVGEGKGKLKAETAVAKLSEIERPEENIETQSGSVGFRTVKRFEIEDLSRLPRDFMIPNEAMIKEAMKNQITIPGVRYFEEQVPINSR